MKLRPARPEDARVTWRWANDRETRARSYRNRRIPWYEHQAWFSARLSSGAARLYVGEDDRGRPVGQVRFERSGPGRGVVSVVVSPEFRGRGLGTALVRRGCVRARRELGLARILAYVKSDNAASRRLFEKSGFVRVRAIRKHGCPSVLLAWPAGPSGRSVDLAE